MDNDSSKIQVFICTCGDILREKLDFEKIKQEIEAFNSSISVKILKFLCIEEGKNRILEFLNKSPKKFVF